MPCASPFSNIDAGMGCQPRVFNAGVMAAGVWLTGAWNSSMARSGTGGGDGHVGDGVPLFLIDGGLRVDVDVDLVHQHHILGGKHGDVLAGGAAGLRRRPVAGDPGSLRMTGRFMLWTLGTGR